MCDGGLTGAGLRARGTLGFVSAAEPSKNPLRRGKPRLEPGRDLGQRRSETGRQFQRRYEAMTGGLTPVTITYNGKRRQLWLDADALVAFETAVAPFIELGQVLASNMAQAVAERRAKGVVAEMQVGSNEHLRAWGVANGFKVGERGRISAELRQAYRDEFDL